MESFMSLETVPVQEVVTSRRRKGKKSTKSLVAAAKNNSGDSKSTNVVYVGRIPHGFYEKEMKGFFGQFGNIKRLRLSRNKTTGKSKHYAFIEFEIPEVAAIVAESMHNYLLCESMLQVKLMPLDKVHPKLWMGANREFKARQWQLRERFHHNRDRTPTENRRLLQSLLKKDKQRRHKLKAAGIDFDFPECAFVSLYSVKEVARNGTHTEAALIPNSSKKIKFSDDS